MKQAEPLSPAHNRMLAMLHEAEGAFVRGAFLAAGGGIPMTLLSGWMRQIRNAHPELVIESKTGSGYRVVIAETAPTDAIDVAPKRPAAVPLHRRMSASMAMVDLLPAKSAEIVKVIAAESGEGFDATMHRLLSYGCEVHRDLVAEGENPVGLRPLPTGTAGQVWQ